MPAHLRQGGQRRQEEPDRGGRVSERMRSADSEATVAEATITAAATTGIPRAGRQLYQYRDNVAGETGKDRVRRSVPRKRQEPWRTVHGRCVFAAAVAGERGQEQRPVVLAVRRAPNDRLHYPSRPVVGGERVQVALEQKAVLRRSHRVLSGGNVFRGLLELSVHGMGRRLLLG